MSTEVIKVLDAVCEKLGLAIDWSSQNVMPQVEELISRYGNYLLVSSICWLIVGIILTIVGVICCKKTFYYMKKYTKTNNIDEYEIYEICMTVIGAVAVIALLVGVPMIFINLANAIKAWTIPEIYAIESLLDMIS